MLPICRQEKLSKYLIPELCADNITQLGYTGRLSIYLYIYIILRINLTDFM